MGSMYMFSLLFLTTVVLETTVSCTNETVYHTMLYVKVAHYLTPDESHSQTFPHTCCRKMPFENCTHFCETVFSVCVGRCEKYLFNITFNYDTKRIYDENYGVGNIDNRMINNENIVVHVTEIRTNLKTGIQKTIPVDILTVEYSRPASTSFWLKVLTVSMLQNKTKIALNVVAFCESDWYYPNKGCSEHIPADDLQERPYKYTKNILEAQLAKFVADKVCSTRTNYITLKIVNVRYNKPLLRVVFSSKCSYNITANASVSTKVIEVSDLKVTQALSFLSPYEERQYFTDPVSRTDLSSTVNRGQFQILFRLKQYWNPKGKFYRKSRSGYQPYRCPTGGCSPQFRFTYNGAKQNIQIKGQAGDHFQDCFGKLVNPQNTRVYTSNSILLRNDKIWDKKVPLQLDIYHNNDDSTIIGFFNISLESIDTVSSSYSTAHPRIVGTTIHAINVSVEVEVMVWCSEGFYGPKCNETCPSNDSSCNIPKCTAEVINSTLIDIYFNCGTGNCTKGKCVCPRGLAGATCNASNPYTLLFNKHYNFKSNDATHPDHCQDNFQGFNCDEIDYCSNHLCKHGSCYSEINRYACSCDNGYRGYNCDVDIDECTNVTCNNNGTCIDRVANYTCNCLNGYTGNNCDVDIDECTNVTCNNNGTCIDRVANYTCNCLNGYTGNNCDVDINECSNVTCNNGICIDQVANYTCNCLKGYTGGHCETDINECSNVTCNNGTCIDQVANYTCNCLQGYTGGHCETDINECSNVTCNNGTCIDQVANYTCNCLKGYTGGHCQTDINECSNVTCNNGTCIDQVANYTCNCLQGYTGGHCETDINECSNVTCNNGTCIDQVANYTCNCLKGYTGGHCETDINECSNVTCNNGTCIDQVANYTCSCINGYEGKNCETDIYDCVNVTCNHGTCIDQVADYTCRCINGYEGKNCKNNIDDCWNVTCDNHGTCIDQTENYICSCLTGYTGSNCEISVDKCANRTCGSRGLQLEDGIYSRCTSSGWNITVNMTVLKQLYPTITRRNIHFGDSSCLGREVGNLLIFQQGFGECLTNKRISGNTLLYVNDLFYAIYDPLKPFIIRQYKWTYTVECDVNRNEATSSHVHHDVDTHHTAITGHYNINMTFFKDVNFMNQLPGNPLHANVGDDIYVKVFTTATDWTIKMRLHTCYTKPSDVADTKTIYYLIKDGCEVDSNTHIISQSTHETRFMFQDFVFSSNREGLNIYCNATFCETKDFSTGCAQSCSSPGTHALIGK